MTPQQFIAKWQRVTLGERSACQQHFLDLCELLGHEKPAAADPEGTHFTFERGASKTDGGDGWAWPTRSSTQRSSPSTAGRWNCRTMSCWRGCWS